MSDQERKSVREKAMDWAIQTAVWGEDPLAVLARAQLYEEHMLATDAEDENQASGPVKPEEMKP